MYYGPITYLAGTTQQIDTFGCPLLIAEFSLESMGHKISVQNVGNSLDLKDIFLYLQDIWMQRKKPE